MGPPSNYGRFKALAEQLVGASGLPAVSLRLANIYGPRQRRDLEGGVVAIFLGCWKRREPITLYGDGRYERDYVYIGDVAEAVLAALAGRHRGVYNIGTGVATSVNDLVAHLSELLGPPPGIDHAPANNDVAFGPVDLEVAARNRREENTAGETAHVILQNHKVILHQMQQRGIIRVHQHSVARRAVERINLGIDQ